MRRALPVLGALVLLAGCGDSGGSSSAKGPEGQFVSLGCASCHTLKAADATGRTGPNLDDLKPTVAQVEQQVTEGGGGMPSYRSRLNPGQIHAIAVYVAGAAGG